MNYLNDDFHFHSELDFYVFCNKPEVQNDNIVHLDSFSKAGTGFIVIPALGRRSSSSACNERSNI